MSIPTWKILPLVQQIGTYLKLAADHFDDRTEAGGPEVKVGDVAKFLEAKMEDWNPKVSGKEVLDAETKAAAARFFAGVVVNYTKD